MSRIHVRISANYRGTLFFLMAASWTTGIVFFSLNRWFMVDGDFGLEKHPWQYPTLQIHGLAAFGMLMAFGALIANHVPAAWKTSRLRSIGLSLLTVLSIQIISAYLLYYLGNEEWRDIISNLHTINGVCLPLVLIGHIVMGMRNRTQVKTH